MTSQAYDNVFLSIIIIVSTTHLTDWDADVLVTVISSPLILVEKSVVKLRAAEAAILR